MWWDPIIHFVTFAGIVKAVPVLAVDDIIPLCVSLKMNGDQNKTLVTRRKVLWCHSQGYFNIGHYSISMGAVPQVLAEFGASRVWP